MGVVVSSSRRSSSSSRGASLKKIGPGAGCSALALGREREELLIAGYDSGEVIVFDVRENFAVSFSFSAAKSGVVRLCYLNAPRRLMVGSVGEGISVWDFPAHACTLDDFLGAGGSGAGSSSTSNLLPFAGLGGAGAAPSPLDVADASGWGGAGGGVIGGAVGGERVVGAQYGRWGGGGSSGGSSTRSTTTGTTSGRIYDHSPILEDISLTHESDFPVRGGVGSKPALLGLSGSAAGGGREFSSDPQHGRGPCCGSEENSSDDEEEKPRFPRLYGPGS